MHSSKQISEIAAALSAAQGKFTNPARNREVTVTTKAGATYKFTYTTLAAIADMVRGPLAANGLAICHSLGTDEQGPSCSTRLLHVSGQWIETWIPVIVAQEANAQGWGSAITYARRYGLCTLLAIIADEDDDANAACANAAQGSNRAAPPRKSQGNGTNAKSDAAASARRAEAWRAIEESESPAILLANAEKVRDDKLIPPGPKRELLDFARGLLMEYSQATIKKIATIDTAEKAAKWYGSMWLLTGEQKTLIVSALGAVREGLQNETPANGDELDVTAAAS